jgi:farnesyl diphosphate synthase
MAKATTLKEFESVFPTLVEDILAHVKQYGTPQMAMDWYKAVN